MESKWKENLTRTMLKLFENESRLFTGTDSDSWAMHIQAFIELSETHDAQNSETLLKFIRPTVGPWPKMVWDKFEFEFEFEFESNHTWIGFSRLAESKYSSEITRA